MEYSVCNDSLDCRVDKKNGQLVSLVLDDFEFMHGGGRNPEFKAKEDKLGWQSSEVECFPVFGSVYGNAIRVKNKTFPLNQHGIARALEKEVLYNGDTITVLTKHDGKSPVRNLKYNDDLPPTFENNPSQYWPFASEITKTIGLGDDGELLVNHRVKNKDPVVMPFMFGWHPAFRTLGSIRDGVINLDGRREIKLEEVVSSQGNVKFVEGIPSLEYINVDSGLGFNISSKGYNGNWVFWMPPNQEQMFCIEPVSHFPTQGRKYFAGISLESLGLRQSKDYQVAIKPFIKS